MIWVFPVQENKTQNTHNHLCCRQSTLPSGQTRCYIQYELHISVLWSQSWQRQGLMPPHAATILAVVTFPWREAASQQQLGANSSDSISKGQERKNIHNFHRRLLKMQCPKLTPGFAPWGIKKVSCNRLKRVRAYFLSKQKQLLAS